MDLTWLLDLDLWLNIGAVVLLVAGVPLVLWALLADWPFGKRRCPRCWYDMRATEGLRCPECGKESKKERRLHRFRRRNGWALLGVVVLLGAWASRGAVVVRNDGWWYAVPRVVLIAGAPVVGAFEDRLEGTRFMREYPMYLEGRVVDAQLTRTAPLWFWERWMARRAGASLVRHPMESFSAFELGAKIYAAGGGRHWESFDEDSRGAVLWQMVRVKHAAIDECSVVSYTERFRRSGEMPQSGFLLNFRRGGLSRVEVHDGLRRRGRVMYGDQDVTRVRGADGIDYVHESGFTETGRAAAYWASSNDLVLDLLAPFTVFNVSCDRVIGEEEIDGEACVIVRFDGLMQCWVSKRELRVLRCSVRINRSADEITTITHFDYDDDPDRFIEGLSEEDLMEPVMERDDS